MSGMLGSNTVLLTAALALLGGIPASSAAPSPSCPHPDLGQSFDYVIVGGGTAGLVVANRLSADPKVKVAVIEAGTFPEDVHGNRTTVPFYQPLLVNSKDPMMWDFNALYQRDGGNQSSGPYYRAKALGGCSSVNHMIYAHTSREGHQMWADRVGDKAYLYDNMQKFYDKSMNFFPPNPADVFPNVTLKYNPADTVTGGILPIIYVRYIQPWSTWFALGLEAIGIPRVNSFIGGHMLGQAFNLATIDPKTSLRSASSQRYLRPVLNRTNLALFDKTMAHRIVFDGKKATGVVVGNSSCILKAKKEVILSAGSVQSPQLLMISGIGPAKLLKSFKIPILADRPGVGQNLQDQPGSVLSYQVNVQTATEAERNPALLASAIDQFNANGTGILASPGGDLYSMERIPAPLASGWSAEVNKSLSQFPAKWPHVGYVALPFLSPFPPAVPIDPKGNYATVLVNIHTISSTGFISINSSKMIDAPIIDLNLLGHPADLQVFIAAFKRMRAALATPALSPVLIGEEVLPGKNVQTDEQIIAYLRQTTASMSHMVGTNKMGKESDPLAVVDKYGKVYGVKNLRVIDASAFPFLPPGPSPHAIVYLLAEKLSQDIRDGR